MSLKLFPGGGSPKSKVTRSKIMEIFKALEIFFQSSSRMVLTIFIDPLANRQDSFPLQPVNFRVVCVFKTWWIKTCHILICISLWLVNKWKNELEFISRVTISILAVWVGSFNVSVLLSGKEGSLIILILLLLKFLIHPDKFYNLGCQILKKVSHRPHSFKSI